MGVDPMEIGNTESAIRNLTSQCKELSRIQLKRSNFVTNDVLLSISENCKKLVFVQLEHVEGEPAETEIAIVSMSEHCTSLKHIQMSGCRVSSSFIERLTNKFPTIKFDFKVLPFSL